MPSISQENFLKRFKHLNRLKVIWESLLKTTRKERMSLAAIFLAAMITGYLGGDGSLRSQEGITRRMLAEEMDRVIFTLIPILNLGFQDSQKNLKFVDFAPAKGLNRGLSIKYSVISGFHDNTFRPNLPLTLSEGLFSFSKLRDFLADHLIRKQRFLEKPISIPDVPKNNWLHQSISKLAVLGAMPQIRANE
ncbi:S-layer homology domain-containing protein, partial [bacterium]|nr:S-layer homology domain-containing protein [bacterium]